MLHAHDVELVERENDPLPVRILFWALHRMKAHSTEELRIEKMRGHENAVRELRIVFERDQTFCRQQFDECAAVDNRGLHRLSRSSRIPWTISSVETSSSGRRRSAFAASSFASR